MSIRLFSLLSDLKNQSQEVCQRMNAQNLTLVVACARMDAKMERFAVHVHLAEEVICVLKHLVQNGIRKFQKSATRTRTRLKILVIKSTLKLSN